MAKFTVGCVPYINAIPLVHRFEELGEESPVKVIYDVPSKLPALLESGQADAILVSSFDALTHPNRRIAEGVCIGSFGPVESVRLFSKVPFGEIRSLALDSSSMTSNALAQILLAENFGVHPTVVSCAPNQVEMLNRCDACVLIGDIGMSAPSDGLNVLDLGDEWTKLTGLPFVWAAWVGGERLTPELVQHLCWAFSNVLDVEIEQLCSEAKKRAQWPLEVIRRYFLQSMRYNLDSSAHQGLIQFKKKLIENGFEANYEPNVVKSAVPFRHLVKT